MRLVIKSDGRYVLRIKRSEWIDIEKQFVKEAGSLPNIPMPQWIDYLKQHGYYYKRTKGDHHTWANIDPSVPSVGFASSKNTHIHPVDLKRALDSIGVKLQDFLAWRLEYYYGIKKKENVDQEFSNPVHDLPQQIPVYLWEKYLKSIGFVPLKVEGLNNHWINYQNKKKVIWIKYDENSIHIDTIKRWLLSINKTIEEFAAWASSQLKQQTA